jgi:DNA-directed RNA polymerase subunit F
LEKIRKINENISESTAVKIADISPSNISTVRAIVSKDKIEINDEEATKIVKELE